MSREGFPGGCNPADVLYKLAHSRGIKAPIFEMVRMFYLILILLLLTVKYLLKIYSSLGTIFDLFIFLRHKTLRKKEWPLRKFSS